MPKPYFSTVARKSACLIKKAAGRKRLSWPLVLSFLESAWLSGYDFGIKETTRLLKTPCTPRKKGV